MTARQILDDAMRELDEGQIEKLAEYASFLRWRREAADWRRFGREQLSRAYGDDEPLYTTADIKDGARA
ncbi:MAG TPA: hypothetical protein VN541_09495 [Tepidisphaeraceae bacterium]|nr:hypothetical protein [Tepidisphaeraceae bacterium]